MQKRGGSCANGKLLTAGVLKKTMLRSKCHARSVVLKMAEDFLR
jgi:hypothetical protein